MPAPTSRIVTADELLAMPDDGRRYELFRGTLVHEPPPGCLHGAFEARLAMLLGAHVDRQGLGQVLCGEPGFTLERDPDTTLAPDVAFISRERWARRGEEAGYWPGAPDLAVEIVSPGNRSLPMEMKVRAYLRAGCRLVWVLDPWTGTATVHRPGSPPRTVSQDGHLDGEDVVPGFQCALSEVFGSRAP